MFVFSFWDWEQGTKINYIYNENLKNTKISAMDFINPHDESLLLCGTGEYMYRDSAMDFINPQNESLLLCDIRINKFTNPQNDSQIYLIKLVCYSLR